MTTRERIHRWHSSSVFTLIALCFVLPFATVTFVGSCSYSGHGRTSFTGIQLVTHTVPRGTGTGDCGGRDERTFIGAAINACVEHASATTAEIAFGAALVGLVLGLLGVAGGPGWCAAVGLGALLQIFLSLGDYKLSPHAGYWLALSLFVWAGILHLRRWRARRPTGVDRGPYRPVYWAAVGVGALAVTLFSISVMSLWLAPLLFAAWAGALNLDRAGKRAAARRASDSAVSEPESTPG